MWLLLALFLIGIVLFLLALFLIGIVLFLLALFLIGIVLFLLALFLIGIVKINSTKHALHNISWQIILYVALYTVVL